MINKQFKLKNPVVDKILSNDCSTDKDLKQLNEFIDPITLIIRSLLGGTEPELASKFLETDSKLINPASLQIDAPRVRYMSPPGLQLSRASTIA